MLLPSDCMLMAVKTKSAHIHARVQTHKHTHAPTFQLISTDSYTLFFFLSCTMCPFLPPYKLRYCKF